MNRSLVVISLITFLLVAGITNSANAIKVGGVLDNDTTWTWAQSPYIIMGSVNVPSDATLTIEPGVEVKFDSDYSLVIDGTLIAVGTEEKKIIFTSNKETKNSGDWGMIQFRDTSVDEACIIEYAVIEYGTTGIRCDSASPTIRNNTIQYNKQYGIRADNSSEYAEDEYGVVNNTIKLTNNVITNNGYGVDISYYSVVTIEEENNISSNSSRGIELYECDNVSVTQNNILDNNRFGLELDECDNASVTDNEIKNTDNEKKIYSTGVSIDGGTVVLTDNEISNHSDLGVYINSGSVTLTGNDIMNNTGDWDTEWWEDSGGGGVWIDYGTLTATGNTITGNANGVGLRAYDWDEITGNTIAGNKVGLVLYNNMPFHFNNLQDNSLYAVYIEGQGQGSIDAGYNWWGTTDAVVIAERIYDADDNRNYYKVDYSPMMTAKVTEDTSMTRPDSPLSVIINGGAAKTDFREVTLELYAESATQMMISEDSNFTDINWEDYTPSKLFTLSEEKGQKYVYAKFRDAMQEEFIAFDSILASSVNELCGVLESDKMEPKDSNLLKTLNESISPYFVVCDVTVPIGLTLKIEPGVEIKFNGNYNLVIDGTLEAVGTKDKNIIFTSNQDNKSPGDWGMIQFRDTSVDGDCIIEYAVIEYGTTGISCDSASPKIRNNTFQNNADYGIYAYNSSENEELGTADNTIEIMTNTIIDSKYGVYVRNYSGVIVENNTLKNTLSDNKKQRISLYGCTATVTNNTLIDSSGIDIQDCIADVIDNTISESSGGIRIRSGTVTLTKNTITECYNGVYIDGWGLFTLIGNTIKNNTGSWEPENENTHGVGIGADVWTDDDCKLTLIGNTITDNQNSAGLRATDWTEITGNTITGNKVGLVLYNNKPFHFNNLHDNSFYDVYIQGEGRENIDAGYNWWGTKDAGVIAEHIYDFYDDRHYSKYKVDYSPMISETVTGNTAMTRPDSPPKIIINGGDTITYVPDVVLELYAESATEMIISEDLDDFADPSWEPYTKTKPFTLSEGQRWKYVYAKFRDVTQKASAIAFSRIKYITDPDCAWAELAELTFISSDISFSKSPEVDSDEITVAVDGDEVTINAIIYNIGSLPANDVIVSFYDGKPDNGGILIGSNTISIPADSGKVRAKVNWNTSGKAGLRQIYVKVDPENAIEECNEENNQNSNNITVLTKPDLTLYSNELFFTPSLSVSPGTEVTINAKVHNQGEIMVTCDVSFYKDTKDAPNLIDTVTNVSVPARGSEIIQTTLDTTDFPVGNYKIVVVISNSEPAESDTNNNEAEGKLFVGYPDTQLVSGPQDGAVINTTSVTFEWIGTVSNTDPKDLLYAYKLDDAPFTEFSPETSHTFDNLAEGEQHTFVVKCKDQAGHEDPEPLIINFTVALIDLEPKVIFPSLPEKAWSGKTIDVTWTIINNGIGTPLGSWKDKVYLSDDANPGSDTLLGEFFNTGNLSNDGSYVNIQTVTLPSEIEGDYWLIVEIDSGNNIDEENAEENNILVADAAINIEIPPPSDLQVTSVTPRGDAWSGRQIGVEWSVTNNGPEKALAGWQDGVYLSRDDQVGDDILIGTFNRDSDLNAGESYTFSRPATLPNYADGDYWIIVATDMGNSIHEHQENNNSLISDESISVQRPPYPDLQVTEVNVPDEALAEGRLEISWEVTNEGTGATDAPFWYDSVYLSLDTKFGDADIYLGQKNNASYLESKESYVQTAEFDIPREIAGPFYLLVKTDSNNKVQEYNAGGNAESNNWVNSATQVQIGLPPKADLQVTRLKAPENGRSGLGIQVTWDVTNKGGARTKTSTWSDTVYLSKDTEFSTQDDIQLGTFVHEGLLDVDSSYTRTEDVTLPVDKWDNYYVFVLTDSQNQVYEQLWDENNFSHDEEAINIILPPPADLEISYIAVSETAAAGNQLAIEWTVKNNSVGETNVSSWHDSVYLSEDEILESESDTLLGRFSHRGLLGADADYTANSTVTLPPAIKGKYYLIVWTDSGENVFEYEKEDCEGDECKGDKNNTNSLPIEIQIANLEVISVLGLGSAPSGTTIPVDWSVSNTGKGITDVDSWKDSVYLSVDETLDIESDTLLGEFAHSGRLGVEEKYTQEHVIVKLPSGIEGKHYLIVWTNSGSEVFESDENDNYAVSSFIQVSLNQADLQAMNISSPQNATAGQSMLIQWTVINSGANASGVTSWQDGLYLSEDELLQPETDILLEMFPHDGGLIPGSKYTRSENATVPLGIPAGMYYVLVNTDENNDVDEHNAEDNNAGSSPNMVQVSSTTPDLQVTNAEAPETGTAGREISISWTVTNTGGAPNTASNWIGAVYLSPDTQFDTDSDIRFGQFTHYGSLPSNGSYSSTQNLKLPQAISGDYYIWIQTDVRDDENEFIGEENNIGFDNTPVKVDFTPADLQITNLNVPDKGWAGQPITVQWAVENKGAGETDVSRWYDNIYFSRDAYFDRTDERLGYLQRNEFLSVKDSYTTSLEVSLPSGVSGPGYIIVFTDSNNQVYEHDDENNNVKISEVINVTLMPLSDLVVSQIEPQIEGQVSGIPGQILEIHWTVTNRGDFNAVGRWWDAVYLSADQEWDIGDAFIGTVEHREELRPEQSYTGSINNPLPGVLPGDYYIIVSTDIRNQVREIDNRNNRGVSSTQISLKIIELMLGVPYPSQFSTGTEHYYRVNVPEGEDLLITLDSDSDVSVNELYVRYGEIPSPVQYDFLYDSPFQSDQEVTVPTTQTGTYYILVRGDYVPDVLETYMIKAELLLFAIRYVNPNRGGNVGNVTVEIVGARFPPNTSARLISPSGLIVNATTVYFNNSSSLFATFDLTGRDSGMYSVQIEKPGGEISTLVNDFEVIDGGDAQIFANLIVPQSIRANSDFIVWLYYENIGNTDMTAPLFIVRSNNALLQIHQGWDEFSEEVFLLGVSNGTLPGVLSPGARNRIPLFSRAGGPGTIEFEVTAITPDVDIPVDWVALQNSTKPYWADPIAWSKFWAKFPERLGSTWGDILTVVADDANRWSLNGTQDYAFDFFYTAQALDICEEIANSPGTIPNFLTNKVMMSRQSKRSWWVVLGEIAKTTLPYALPPLVSELVSIALNMDCFSISLLMTVCHYRRGRILIETGDPFDPRIQALKDLINRLSPLQEHACFGEPLPPDYKPPLPDTEDAETPHDSERTSSVGSSDPNEKQVSAGSGENVFISADSPQSYTIYFENIPEATAPAEQVFITDQLDSNLDWRSFRLGEIAFGDTVISVPENRSAYQTRITLESGMLLYIDAGIDITTGEVNWLLRTVDPNTGEPPIDPSLGFLPPNDENHSGEGHVTFTIKPKDGLEDGTEITNRATIIFDDNEAIDTNEVTNIIQSIRPDLTVTSFTIQSERPVLIEGEELTLTATIQNNSEVPANKFSVQFFDGGPDANEMQIGSTQVVEGLAAKGTHTIQMTWAPTRLSGERQIQVKVDAEDTVSEVNEQNNVSGTSLVLYPHSFTVNLAKGINMFALPLEPETPYTARSLAAMIGATVMIRYDTASEHFKTFVPNIHTSDGFLIEGSTAYIANVDEAKPVTFEGISHLSTIQIEPEINMLSLPLQPETPFNARSFANKLGADIVVRYNDAGEPEAFIPDSYTGNGFEIEGGKGYIVMAPEAKSVAFTGKGWMDDTQSIVAPMLANTSDDSNGKCSSIFGVAGYIYKDDGKIPVSKAYTVAITNKRTNVSISAAVDVTSGQYGGAFVEILNKETTYSGDKLEITVIDSNKKIVGGPVIYTITTDDIKNRYAKLNTSLTKPIPKKDLLAQNFPNPFNPDTWIPYQLSKDVDVTVKIYNVAGQLVRTLELGRRSAGYYMEKEKAAHWDGRNDTGEQSASGIYFYTIKAGKFTATKKMVILK